MELYVKTFDQLTTRELYELLQARAAVFVVEQHCPYLDPDGDDAASVHVFLRDQAGLAACLRFHRDGPGRVRIGRVLTLRRGQGLGLAVMEAAVAAIRQLSDVREIVLDAQSYAVGFYQKLGFHVTAPEHLEDDIPHKEMRLML